MKDGESAPVEYAFESISELRDAHEQLLDEFDRALDVDGAADAEIAAVSHLEPGIRSSTRMFLLPTSSREPMGGGVHSTVGASTPTRRRLATCTRRGCVPS